MHRVWDWIVGLSMIAISVFIGGFFALLIAIPVTVAIGHAVDLQEKWGRWAAICSFIGVFVLLQAAGFYDYYYRRRVNYVIGKAGTFHLIPRAIQRMRTGYELQGFTDAATGKPTTIQAPINAGRRGFAALLVIIISVIAFGFGATAKGDWTLVVAGLGLIGTFTGLVLLAQAALAYAGFIRRNIEREETK